MAIAVTHFTDPGCPWAYSARPALLTLEWRFGDQLEWEIVVIGDPADPRCADVPLLAGRGLVDGAPAAYVCERMTCRTPITDPDALRAALA